MSNMILLRLKRKLDEISAYGYGEVGIETQRNTLKEELQFYVLDFIYHHPDYSRWIMYGGSALRICHGLDRMSVDLDFEIGNPISNAFLDELKSEVETYFKNAYNSGPELLTVKITTGRGLLLRFHVGDELGINHPSKQVHVKIDLNHFATPKAVIERRPINRDQFSFVMVTYSMSTLMASKIAAIFLRGQRGVGKVVYEEKGRDIYDLLWYMAKKVVPNLDYLAAKGMDVKNPRDLFDKLTLKMNKVSDANLKQDLTPLFVNQMFIENWLKNWRESYLSLLPGYKIHTVVALKSIRIHKDFDAGVFSFVYEYVAKKGGVVIIRYLISEYWIDDREGDLSLEIEDEIKNVIEFSDKSVSRRAGSRDKLMQYATLFYGKNENYFKKTNRMMFGDTLTTRLISQVALNKSALISSELEELLK